MIYKQNFVLQKALLAQYLPTIEIWDPPHGETSLQLVACIESPRLLKDFVRDIS